MYGWHDESSNLRDFPSPPERGFASSASSGSPPPPVGGDGPGDDTVVEEEEEEEEEERARRALLGFAPRHLHHKHRTPRKRSSPVPDPKRPCPLEYDSAYSSLFVPPRNQYERSRRGGKSHPRGGGGRIGNDSSFDGTHPPPPWFYAREKESIWLRYLPSLRRTMLVGLGLSLTSSLAYCVQLLYPPLLALWGGATMVLGGALMNVLVTRWSYRRFVADWLEEWRWRREVRRYKMHREELMKEQGVIDDGRLQGFEGVEKDESLFVSDNVESVQEPEVAESAEAFVYGTAGGAYVEI
jgi:hypothetical protein